MQKYLFTVISLLFCVMAFGQKKIESSLTEAHQNLTGTKVSLIAPEGFTEAQNFLGLQQNSSGSSIMVIDFPAPYSEATKALTKENLLSQGVELKKIEKLSINEIPAILVTGTQQAYGNLYTKYILTFGTEQETLMIHGIFPENLKKLGKQIKKSLLTVYYEQKKEVNPFEVLDFSIDVSNTKLKFSASISKSLVFNVDGELPSSSEDNTILIVGKSISPIDKADKKSFAINRLKQMPIEMGEIADIKEISIDNVSGYEIFAEGKDTSSSETLQVYQVMLFTDDLYYIFLGTTNDETDASMEQIKKAILTFKRK